MPRTAYEQNPYAGARYPFAFFCQLADIFLDLYLEYPPRSTIQLPLSLTWAYGFGTILSPPIWTPTHNRDIHIRDADNNLIFDSTLASDFSLVAWGSDREIITWKTSESLCRLVAFTLNRDELNNHISSNDGILDPRTYVQANRSVTKLVVNNINLTGQIEFEAGYNTKLESAGKAFGDYPGERIEIDGRPGAGEGRTPGCDDPEPVVKKINNIRPTQDGNFFITAESCHRIAPAENFGAAIPGTIKISNDCEPCCTCKDYAFTYRALKRVWDRWASVAANLEIIRDLHKSNVDRWNEAKACRQAKPLRITANPEARCGLFVGISYCNPYECCITGAKIILSVSASNSIRVIETDMDSRNTIPGQPYSAEVTGNGTSFVVVTYYPEIVDPYKSVVIRTRFRADDRDTIAYEIRAVFIGDPVVCNDNADPSLEERATSVFG